MAKRSGEIEGFEDYLPVMADKLGEEGFMGELCNRFHLLADPEKGVITLESLKKNANLLGMEEMSEDQVRAMIESADLNADGVLDQNEFCVLMLRLSPPLMAEANKLLENALVQELEGFVQEK